ncbi:MAG: BamA/TamA family outer membrane protein, partial [Ignavibacteria bacterium]|nr:BamA/TamA family outer membrane protein [Ignavibacteria bacterium]
VYAELYTEEDPVRVVIHVQPNPFLNEIRIPDVSRIDREGFISEYRYLYGTRYRPHTVVALLEELLSRYRNNGYSLARVNGVSFSGETGILTVDISEGMIASIRVQGMERTEDYVVLREFPLEEGDVFRIDEARKGVANISGTTLFDYVNLGISYADHQPELTINLHERPSQLLSLGMRIDNERNLQGLLEIRDDNLAGTGTSAGISVSGGSRNQEYLLDLHSHRLFSTSLSLRGAGFLSVFDSYLYADAEQTDPNCWSREEAGEYRDRRYGGLLAFGTQIEKVGNTFLEYSLQSVRVSNKQDLPQVDETYDLSRLRIGTMVDSKNSYPFPTSGVWADLSFEFAFEGLGGDVSYNAVRAGAETYLTWGKRHTLHPKGFVGFADKTMPFGEQFRLGGREMLFGTREDDKRGRQVLLFNLEYRYLLPFQILFDTYLHLRYDIGTISEIPEQIKFSSFRHGVGAEIALDTPIGPGSLGAGKSFYFEERSPGSSVQHGPILFYFAIGYQLYRP